MNVNALGRAVLVQEFSDGAALFAGFKRLSQTDRVGNDGGLRGIATQFAAGYFFGIGFKQHGHLEDVQKNAEHGDVGRNNSHKAKG